MLIPAREEVEEGALAFDRIGEDGPLDVRALVRIDVFGGRFQQFADRRGISLRRASDCSGSVTW
jgi:hypothetical protein